MRPATEPNDIVPLSPMLRSMVMTRPEGRLPLTLIGKRSASVSVTSALRLPLGTKIPGEAPVDPSIRRAAMLPVKSPWLALTRHTWLSPGLPPFMRASMLAQIWRASMIWMLFLAPMYAVKEEEPIVPLSARTASMLPFGAVTLPRILPRSACTRTTFTILTSSRNGASNVAR